MNNVGKNDKMRGKVGEIGNRKHREIAQKASGIERKKAL